MKLTKRKLRILIESFLKEGEVIQFPGAQEAPPEPEEEPAADAHYLEKLAVQKGTMVQNDDGSYKVRPDILRLGLPYDVLMGTMGAMDLLGDFEEFGPFEYQINISKARGPVDAAELSGPWDTSEEVEDSVNKLILAGGLLSDLLFRSVNPEYSNDAWRSMEDHVFEGDAEMASEFYKEFSKYLNKLL